MVGHEESTDGGNVSRLSAKLLRGIITPNDGPSRWRENGPPWGEKWGIICVVICISGKDMRSNSRMSCKNIRLSNKSDWRIIGNVVRRYRAKVSVARRRSSGVSEENRPAPSISMFRSEAESRTAPYRRGGSCGAGAPIGTSRARRTRISSCIPNYYHFFRKGNCQRSRRIPRLHAIERGRNSPPGRNLDRVAGAVILPLRGGGIPADHRLERWPRGGHRSESTSNDSAENLQRNYTRMSEIY